MARSSYCRYRRLLMMPDTRILHVPVFFIPPIAFAIVMSTGTLANITLGMSGQLPILAPLANFLSGFTFIIALFLFPTAAICWLKNRALFAAQCALPASIALFATAGIALLVMGNQCFFFDLGSRYAFLLWLAGTILLFFINITAYYRIFIGRHTLEHITPVFFLPIVGLLAIPPGGCALVLAGYLPDPLLFISLSALGGGLLLYFSLAGLMFQRHIFLDPLPDHLAPTYWIHLAPICWGCISMIALAHITAPAIEPVIRFLCLAGWGACVWWSVMAGLLTVRALLRKGMVFSLAWWSFIFPLGAFALLTRFLDVPFKGEIGIAIWLFMAFIWICASLRTAILAAANVMALLRLLRN